MKKKEGPKQVREALQKYLDKAGISEKIEAASVVPEWPKLVGEGIAAVTTPLRVTNGVLVVVPSLDVASAGANIVASVLRTSIPEAPHIGAPFDATRWTRNRRSFPACWPHTTTAPPAPSAVIVKKYASFWRVGATWTPAGSHRALPSAPKRWARSRQSVPGVGPSGQTTMAPPFESETTWGYR